MKIGIATDHRGVDHKKTLITFLQQHGYEVIDLSPVNTPTDDYVDFAAITCESYLNHNIDFGILLCRTGIGMSIAANKIKGIRCAKVSNEEEAFLTRNDNDANIIALSYIEEPQVLGGIILKFLETPFSSDERHHRRVNKIIALEEKHD